MQMKLEAAPRSDDDAWSARSEVIFKKSSNHYAQLDLGVCYP